MKVGICLGLSAGIALLAATGCSQTQQSIVRGQSPVVQASGEYDGPLIGTAPGYGERPHINSKHRDFRAFSNHHSHVLGHEDGAYDGKEQFYADHQKYVYDVGGNSSGCPACNGGMNCPADGCPHCGCGCHYGCPSHYQTYQYNWPRNLVYPSPIVPAGMVQYPYYTLRGPTDFFME